MTVSSHSPSSIQEGLRDLGIRAGDLVMPHVSMRAVGSVENGAAGLLEAILQTVGTEGTIFMVFGADAAVPFDATTSPADPEMGVFAEIFRTHPETKVNDHAAARSGALGPLADHLISNPPLHDYYAPGSPLHRFCEHQGRILRLGADRDTITLTHLAEYLADIPIKRRARRRYVRADTGEQWIECLDDCDGVFDWQPGDYFTQILTDFLRAGHARTGPVGNCNAELFTGTPFVEFAVTWMEEHL